MMPTPRKIMENKHTYIQHTWSYIREHSTLDRQTDSKHTRSECGIWSWGIRRTRRKWRKRTRTCPLSERRKEINRERESSKLFCEPTLANKNKPASRAINQQKRERGNWIGCLSLTDVRTDPILFLAKEKKISPPKVTPSKSFLILIIVCLAVGFHTLGQPAS